MPSAELVKHQEPLPPREALILNAVLHHPWLLEEDAERLAAIDLTSPVLARLRDAILEAAAVDNSLDSATLASHLTKLGMDKVLSLVQRSMTHKCDRFAEPQTERAEVEVGWRHALALHERQVGLKRSLEAAQRAWHEDRSEEAFARICEIQGLIGQLSEADETGAFKDAG